MATPREPEPEQPMLEFDSPNELESEAVQAARDLFHGRTDVENAAERIVTAASMRGRAPIERSVPVDEDTPDLGAPV